MLQLSSLILPGIRIASFLLPRLRSVAIFYRDTFRPGRSNEDAFEDAFFYFSFSLPAFSTERFITALKSLGIATVFDILATKSGIRPPGWVKSV